MRMRMRFLLNENELVFAVANHESECTAIVEHKSMATVKSQKH
jgi:hypothetical protein